MNALREVGAIDWGANYGAKGRSSNEYALAPHRPFKFDRETVPPVTAKNERHRPVTVRNEGHPTVISDRNPPFKNDRVVESTDVVESTGELETPLSSSAQPDPPEPAAAPVEERESSPLVGKLKGIHHATAAEVRAVLDQVAREGWAKSLSAWALSATGELDFAERLAKTRAKPAPVAVNRDPWQECGCGRVFQAPEPRPCRDCREKAEQPDVAEPQQPSDGLRQLRAARQARRPPALPAVPPFQSAS
jgi:hypothetical protein